MTLLLLLLLNEAHAMVFTKLPHFVLVKNKMYEVHYLAEVDNGDLYGACFSGKEKKIEVSISEGLDEAQSTLLHEVLHAIAAEYRFSLPEKKVLELEKAIYETFKKNRWKIQTN